MAFDLKLYFLSDISNFVLKDNEILIYFTVSFLLSIVCSDMIHFELLIHVCV